MPWYAQVAGWSAAATRPCQFYGPLPGTRAHAGRSGAVSHRGRSFLAPVSPNIGLIRGAMVGGALLPCPRVHLLSPIRFLRTAAFIQSVLWERLSSWMGRRCRTVSGTGRGAGSRQGRSPGVCAGAAPRSGPVGEFRSCAVTARPPHVVGDGGLVAALARAAGGYGIHVHLLEGRVLTCRSRVL